MRPWLFAVSLALSPLAYADAIQPGNWEFTVTVNAEGLGALGPKPGPIVNTRCISQEQANDPAKVLGDAGAKAIANSPTSATPEPNTPSMCAAPAACR